MSAEVFVYDLLGRRLFSFRAAEDCRSRESINATVRSRGALALGAKIVRFRTESEVRTWRLAP